jgi:hypothetical protein
MTVVRSVNVHLASVALIQIIATGQAPKPCSIGFATGFFFEQEGRTFLVTNRHVVVKEEDEFYPDRLVVRIHTSKTDILPTRDVVLPLYEANGRPLWLEHSKGIDIIALEIGHLLKETDMVTCWKPDNVLQLDAKLEVGSQVLVIGYPMGLYEPKSYLPILRSGMLATTYGIAFDELPLCLIDANLHKGDSGSPVLTVPSEVIEGVALPPSHLPSYLLGVNSGSYSVRGVALGLNAVWYGNLILHIVSQGRPNEPTVRNSHSEPS